MADDDRARLKDVTRAAASHSVASHLALSPAKYDARIRTLIPLYDELIAKSLVRSAMPHAP
jgi:hypothetical protein